MARLPRLDLPDIPQHVVQRGNNRSACFFSDRDRLAYLSALKEASATFGCQVHAYVLMTNHAHLLLTGRQKGAVSSAMQSLGRRYVRYINGVRQRTGTLFEGRFKASLIETERYLMTCYRYIELNPVRAAIVGSPDEYPWSSYRHNALGEPDSLITCRPEYLELGDTPEARQHAYRQLFQETFAEGEIDAIRAHLNKDCALGSPQFQSQVEALAKRRARVVGLGRPRKSPRKLNLTPL